MSAPASQRSLFCCLLEEFYSVLDWDGSPEYAHQVKYEADNLLQTLGVSLADAAEAECQLVLKNHFSTEEA